MQDYQPQTYGDAIAPLYDDLYPEAPADMVERLIELAGEGPVLELGIGTGRVALPLVEAGLEVWGVDASEAMLARLREKPGGDRVQVLQGDFARFELSARFSLVYVVFNTFFALLSQQDQLACFETVARHLRPAGAFVLEVYVPDPCRFVSGQAVRVREIGPKAVHLDVSRHDPVAQQVTTQHLFLGEEGLKMVPVRMRYAWPSELDLMARLAGLTLRQRRGSWSGETFTAESRQHISVYGLAEA